MRRAEADLKVRARLSDIKPLLSGPQLNGHPYQAASNKSPNEGFSIVFTSIEWGWTLADVTVQLQESSYSQLSD